MTWLDWNVVATTRPHNYPRARQLLARFGDVETTEFFNVLVLRTEDPGAFLEAYAERRAEDDRLDECLARVVPLMHVFDFATPAEFEAKAKAVVADLLPQMAGKAFHVRMSRRGFKHEMSSQSEERFLDDSILTGLEERGSPGRLTFENPDLILDVETVGTRAGLSLWSAEDLKRFPFLKVD